MCASTLKPSGASSLNESACMHNVYRYLHFSHTRRWIMAVNVHSNKLSFLLRTKLKLGLLSKMVLNTNSNLCL